MNSWWYWFFYKMKIRKPGWHTSRYELSLKRRNIPRCLFKCGSYSREQLTFPSLDRAPPAGIRLLPFFLSLNLIGFSKIIITTRILLYHYFSLLWTLLDFFFKLWRHFQFWDIYNLTIFWGSACPGVNS